MAKHVGLIGRHDWFVGLHTPCNVQVYGCAEATELSTAGRALCMLFAVSDSSLGPRGLENFAPRLDLGSTRFVERRIMACQPKAA